MGRAPCLSQIPMALSLKYTHSLFILAQEKARICLRIGILLLGLRMVTRQYGSGQIKEWGQIHLIGHRCFLLDLSFQHMVTQSTV